MNDEWDFIEKGIEKNDEMIQVWFLSLISIIMKVDR
jgi:hypothetical protein